MVTFFQKNAQNATGADRVRERLALDGIESVIPPLPGRGQKPPFDKERYRSRNRVERFFNKLKQFRRIANPQAQSSPSGVRDSDGRF